jgi:extradiol dioxygenase family protein
MLANAPIHAYVPASDLDRCRRFYEEKLGLAAGKPVEGGLTFECGGGTAFFMYPSPGAGSNRASCAFWSVDDIEAVVAWLKQRGVVFEEYDAPGLRTEGSIHTSETVKAAWFKDTEGNIMAISQSIDG